MHCIAGGKDGGIAYKELAATSDTDDRGDAVTTADLPQQLNAAEEEAAENRLLGTSGGGVAAVNGPGRRGIPEVLTTTNVVVAGPEPGGELPDRRLSGWSRDGGRLLFDASMSSLPVRTTCSRARHALRQAHAVAFSSNVQILNCMLSPRPPPPPLLLSPCQSSLVFRVVSHELLYLASIASERPPTSFLFRCFWSLTTTAVVRKPLKSHLFMAKISLSLSVIWYFSQWSYATSLGYTRYDGMMVSYTHVCPVASPGTYDGWDMSYMRPVALYPVLLELLL